MRSVESVLEELTVLQRQFRKSREPGLVLFLDDTLTVSRPRAIRLFEGIQRLGLRMHFSGFTRANTIATSNGRKADLAFASLMKNIGFRSISFGIETGSEAISQRMNKGVTLDHYRRAYEILESVDFEERRGSFIIGHPYETAQSIQESIAFAKELRIHRLGVNIMTPYPGTEAFESARRGSGLYFEPAANNYDNYRRWGKSVVSTDALSAEALEYWHRRFLTDVYSSWNCVRHGLRELGRGNASAFYHRPVVDALTRRLKMKVLGSWRHVPDFGERDHSGYNPSDWGQAHITKQDCLNFLKRRYPDGNGEPSVQLRVLPETTVAV